MGCGTFGAQAEMVLAKLGQLATLPKLKVPLSLEVLSQLLPPLSEQDHPFFAPWHVRN